MQRNMGLAESIQQLNRLICNLSKDLVKVQRGNKASAQRVRVGTIHLEKIAKRFRKESIDAEKTGKFKKRRPKKKKRRAH